MMMKEKRLNIDINYKNMKRPEAVDRIFNK